MYNDFKMLLDDKMSFFKEDDKEKIYSSGKLYSKKYFYIIKSLSMFGISKSLQICINESYLVESIP